MHLPPRAHSRTHYVLEVEESRPFYLQLTDELQLNDAKFRAREKSNVDKIEKLRRKAADTEGSLRCIQLARATWTVRQSTLSKSSSQLDGYCKGGFIMNL